MRALAALGGAAVLAAGATAAPPVRIAFTVDDLPVHGPLPPGETRLEVARRMIAALQAAGLPPVTGFVNAGAIDGEPASAPVLDLWRTAGFPLGNHGRAHLDLDQVGVAAFTADVAADEPLLQAKMGAADWRWFRFPFLHEGRDPAARTEVRGWLADHGYRIAAVSMSFGDYLWNPPYARCATAGDKAGIAALERSYLTAASEALDAADPARPQVLLMHIGAFDARMLPRLLRLYRTRRVRFVSLAEAERDPIYAGDRDPRLAPTSPGVTAQPRHDYTAELDALCRRPAPHS